MNKLILIGLFMVLASQLKLAAHPSKDPLSGKTFIITSNALKKSELNGINVSFTDGSVFFKGCNNC